MVATATAVIKGSESVPSREAVVPFFPIAVAGRYNPLVSRVPRPSRNRAFATVLLIGLLLACGSHEPAEKGRQPVVSGAEARRGIQYREHHIEGLRVLEVVVGRVDFEARLPIVMHLHGRGDRARVPEGGYDPARAVRIIIPEAPRPSGLGFAWSPVSITADRPLVLGAALVRESDRLVRVLRHIERMREVQGRPLVTGFSQGGMLTYAIAVRHPEAIGGALPISGWIPPHIVPRERPARDRRVPILALHGTGDKIVPVGPTRVAVRRLRHLGYDVHLEEFPGVEHEIVPEMRRRHRELIRRVFRRTGGDDGPSA